MVYNKWKDKEWVKAYRKKPENKLKKRLYYKKKGEISKKKILSKE